MSLDEIKSEIAKLNDSIKIIDSTYDTSSLETEKEKLISEQSSPEFYSDRERCKRWGSALA